MIGTLRWRDGKFVADKPLRTRIAIVSYADGRYARVADKLVATAQRYNPNIDVFVFRSPTEIGSPPHSQDPYAFKVYAVQRAREMGYTTVLWCDSCLRLTRPLESLVDTIESVGVYLQEDGYDKQTGQWANDRALEYFHKTRDEAMAICPIYACFMGFDFTKPITREFFSRWKKACIDGIFRGAWTNTNKTESQDERCKGHRHDQTCAELIAHDLKIPLQQMIYTYDPTYAPRYFTGWDHN
jgi:hypothetical protein